MSLGVEFLLQLRDLCQQELSKRGLKDSQANPDDPVSKPVCFESSRFDGSYRAGNRWQSNRLLQEQDDKPQVVLPISTKIFKDIPIKSENPENSTIESKEYRCAKCDYFATSHSDYVIHAQSCVPVELVRCLHCTESVKAEELDNHINFIHMTADILKKQDDGLYHCAKCNVKFNYLSQAKIHVETLTHKGMDRCHSCGVVLLLGEMMKHQKEVHGKSGDNWVCKVCGLKYASKMILDRHITCVHERKEMFKCKDCGATFARGDALRKHEVLHSETRPFSCCFCELSFKDKETLKGHMHNIHFRGRYQCQFCYRGFADQDKCDMHVKGYHETGYHCMVCGEVFKTYHKRERHFSKHLFAGNNKKNIKRTDSSEEESDSYEKENGILKTTKRGQTQKHQRPLVESDNRKSKTDSLKSKKSIQEKQVKCSSSRKRKTDVQENCENDNLSRRKRLRSSKNVVSEMPYETEQMCDNSYSKNDMSAIGSHLVTCSSEKKESFHESISNGAEKPSSGCTANADKPLPNFPTMDVSASVETVNSDNEQAVAVPVSTDAETGNESFCNCSDAELEEEANLVDLEYSLQPCSTIPEDVLFIDVSNLPDADCTIDSFSSLRPNSSITESTLVIDIDNIPQYESIGIIDLSSVGICPAEVQCLEVVTDSVGAALPDVKAVTGRTSFCSDDFSEQLTGINVEIDNKLCNKDRQDGRPLTKDQVKKKVTKKSTSKRKPKLQKYPDSGKKVTVKNLFTNDDDFVLPEFVLEEDE